MTDTKYVHSILNGTIASLKSVVPFSATIHPPALLDQPFDQQEMGVLIGVVGDLRGRIILDSAVQTFRSIGAAMYGMELEGEMLESFTGELGNMLAGNLCTNASADGVTIDITPPTVMVGHTKLSGFRHAFKINVEFEDIGNMHIILALDEN